MENIKTENIKMNIRILRELFFTYFDKLKKTKAVIAKNKSRILKHKI